MIGQQATISEILLTEQPNAIDLQCHEQMPPEEEEQDLRETYRVTVDCGLCKKSLCFLCLADGEDIYRLNRLLFTLSLICFNCVKYNKFNHGG
nr:MAG: early protein 7 [Ailuropoda melanoleuca papillomavirus 5]